MADGSDFTTLIASVDLGVLAAGLTLLAIYPAIGLFVAQRLSSAKSDVLIAYERSRRVIFSRLGRGVACAWASLMLLLIGAAARFLESALMPRDAAAPNCSSDARLSMWNFLLLGGSGMLAVLSPGFRRGGRLAYLQDDRRLHLIDQSRPVSQRRSDRV